KTTSDQEVERPQQAPLPRKRLSPGAHITDAALCPNVHCVGCGLKPFEKTFDLFLPQTISATP
ncbi:hypothetical protein, partial [Planktotalea frisia]|uniref:hypothetical protein n=1 Tax=Planktotalea frisia TaxID=696762 RepID=UPI001C31C024